MKWLILKYIQDFLVCLIISEVCKSLADDPLLDPGIHAKMKIQQLPMVSNHFVFFFSNLLMESAPSCQGKDLFQYFTAEA